MRRKRKPSTSERPTAAGHRQKSSESASVRIIGGQWRGRRMQYKADPRTRPMKDRVREAVFNLLGDMTGTAAIDLFAGTGALGLEALSRGAQTSVFLERHFPTAESIRRNAAAFGAGDRCHVLSVDTFIHFRGGLALPPQIGELRWVVFCSPPYDFYDNRRDEMLKLIALVCQAAPAESAFVVEADERFDPSLLPERFDWDVRAYPPAHVAVGWKRDHSSS